MKWFKKLKKWQKGGLIGLGIGVIVLWQQVSLDAKIDLWVL